MTTQKTFDLKQDYSDYIFDKTKQAWVKNEKDGWPVNWYYEYNPECTSEYTAILYLNGCSWIQRMYLNNVLAYYFPNCLIVNNAENAFGNLQIISGTVNDIHNLSKQSLPVFAYISFTEVCRNKKELWFANPKRYSNLTDYFRSIQQEEWSLLDSKLRQYPIDYCITTSFVYNSFNDEKRILDYCGYADNQEVYRVNVGVTEYLKNYNHVFLKSDLGVYIDNLEEIIEYKKSLLELPYIDETIHPYHWSCYQPVVDYFKKAIDNL